MHGEESLVECQGLEKRYGNDRALAGIDLLIPRGKTTAIVGPSGCGKSTLLHLMGAMDRPDCGHVLFDGRDLTELDDSAASRLRREEIGFVFQFFNLIPALRVLENVMLPARLGGQRPGDCLERARKLLDRVGLQEKTGSYPDRLSGGEQQRVAIARALMNRPRLILADEPTGALDRSTGAAISDLLASLVTEDGTTLVVATHSEVVAAAAHDTVRLEDGRIVQGP